MPRQKHYCTIDGCDAPQVGRGLCRKHYTRWDRYGDPLYITPVEPRGVCTIDGCDLPQKAHGWCQTHYRRWTRHANPETVVKIRHPGSPEDRFWAKVKIQPDGCWVWQGTLGTHGYGQFAPAGRMRNAYRWGYEQFVGPVPEGMELDHKCRNRACVRFDHLEPVTHAENVRRGEGPSAKNTIKTHCPKGHAYDDANTYRYKNGTRECIACRHERRRKE